MSANRFILSQVCLPAFLLPFPPFILSILKNESLCPKGFISVYMLYDKDNKKTAMTGFNYYYAIQKTKEKNKRHDAEIESKFIISRKDDDLKKVEEINYSDHEVLDISQFEAELIKADKFDSEFNDNVFLKTMQKSIVSEALEIRKEVIKDFIYSALFYDTNNLKSPSDSLNIKNK